MNFYGLSGKRNKCKSNHMKAICRIPSGLHDPIFYKLSRFSMWGNAMFF